jgi:hypothetical protein
MGSSATVTGAGFGGGGAPNPRSPPFPSPSVVSSAGSGWGVGRIETFENTDRRGSGLSVIAVRWSRRRPLVPGNDP